MKFLLILNSALLVTTLIGCARSLAPEQGNGAANGSGIRDEAPTGTATELYAMHCAACHGETGDGQGVGARTVFPAPRNFRAGWFRLVSSHSLRPTEADIEQVLFRGMPGSSMPSFAKLNPADRKLLAEHVLSLWREAIHDKLTAEVAASGEQVSAEEIVELVKHASSVDEKVCIPAFGEASPESIKNGEAIYLKQSCHSCHGTNGMGDPEVALFDNEGELVRPRDLVNEPFKGGQDAESIYLRILLGMPGSPHPSSANLSPTELIDLVHYIRSIGANKKITLTGYQRRLYASSREYLRSLNKLSAKN